MISRRCRIALALAGTLLALAVAVPVEAGTLTISIIDNGSCTGTWQTGGTISNPTFTCVMSSPPPPAGAPACNVTPSQTITGGSIDLLMNNCSPSTGTTFTWQQGSTTLCTAARCTVTPPPGSTTYAGTVTANGTSTTYTTTITVQPTSTGGSGSCSGYNVVDLGNLNFDGTRLDSHGVSGSAVAVGTITIPSGFNGKTSSVSVFENGNGINWRHVTLSKSRCDFGARPPAAAGGTGPTLYMSIGGADSTKVGVYAGEVWYLNVKNEYWTPTSTSPSSSCGAGQDCDFGVKLYPPN